MDKQAKQYVEWMKNGKREIDEAKRDQELSNKLWCLLNVPLDKIKK
jgi:hypothetical protein